MMVLSVSAFPSPRPTSAATQQLSTANPSSAPTPTPPSAAASTLSASSSSPASSSSHWQSVDVASFRNNILVLSGHHSSTPRRLSLGTTAGSRSNTTTDNASVNAGLHRRTYHHNHHSHQKTGRVGEHSRFDSFSHRAAAATPDQIYSSSTSSSSASSSTPSPPLAFVPPTLFSSVSIIASTSALLPHRKASLPETMPLSIPPSYYYSKQPSSSHAIQSDDAKRLEQPEAGNGYRRDDQAVMFTRPQTSAGPLSRHLSTGNTALRNTASVHDLPKPVIITAPSQQHPSAPALSSFSASSVSSSSTSHPTSSNPSLSITSPPPAPAAKHTYPAPNIPTNSVALNSSAAAAAASTSQDTSTDSAMAMTDLLLLASTGPARPPGSSRSLTAPPPVLSAPSAAPPTARPTITINTSALWPSSIPPPAPPAPPFHHHATNTNNTAATHPALLTPPSKVVITAPPTGPRQPNSSPNLNNNNNNNTQTAAINIRYQAMAVDPSSSAPVQITHTRPDGTTTTAAAAAVAPSSSSSSSSRLQYTGDMRVRRFKNTTHLQTFPSASSASSSSSSKKGMNMLEAIPNSWASASRPSDLRPVYPVQSQSQQQQQSQGGLPSRSENTKPTGDTPKPKPKPKPARVNLSAQRSVSTDGRRVTSRSPPVSPRLPHAGPSSNSSARVRKDSWVTDKSLRSINSNAIPVPVPNAHSSPAAANNTTPRVRGPRTRQAQCPPALRQPTPQRLSLGMVMDTTRLANVSPPPKTVTGVFGTPDLLLGSAVPPTMMMRRTSSTNARPLPLRPSSASSSSPSPPTSRSRARRYRLAAAAEDDDDTYRIPSQRREKLPSERVSLSLPASPRPPSSSVIPVSLKATMMPNLIEERNVLGSISGTLRGHITTTDTRPHFARPTPASAPSSTPTTRTSTPFRDPFAVVQIDNNNHNDKDEREEEERDEQFVDQLLRVVPISPTSDPENAVVEVFVDNQYYGRCSRSPSPIVYARPLGGDADDSSLSSSEEYDDHHAQLRSRRSRGRLQEHQQHQQQYQQQQLQQKLAMVMRIDRMPASPISYHSDDSSLHYGMYRSNNRRRRRRSQLDFTKLDNQQPQARLSGKGEEGWWQHQHQHQHQPQQQREENERMRSPSPIRYAPRRSFDFLYDEDEDGDEYGVWRNWYVTATTATTVGGTPRRNNANDHYNYNTVKSVRPGDSPNLVVGKRRRTQPKSFLHDYRKPPVHVDSVEFTDGGDRATAAMDRDGEAEKERGRKRERAFMSMSLGKEKEKEKAKEKEKEREKEKEKEKEKVRSRKISRGFLDELAAVAAFNVGGNAKRATSGSRSPKVKSKDKDKDGEKKKRKKDTDGDTEEFGVYDDREVLDIGANDFDYEEEPLSRVGGLTFTR